VTVRRLEATVRGRVQGVGFRWFVVRHARRLGIAGWTANEPDGSVSVVAEGTDDALRELLGHIRAGPPGAGVARLDERWLDATGTLADFRIRAGGHGGD
jgi:acylphosphatase